MTLYLDLETYSECPISHGTPRYASHPSTEILLIAYAVGDEPVNVWDLTCPTTLPHDLARALLSDCPVVIHNSFFDRSVMRETGFFDLPPERIEDTMVQALAHGLPGALDKLGTAFGLAEDKAKSKAGRALIHFFCKPVRGKRNFSTDHPERWAQFVDYAAQDVVAMRELHRKMPRWNYPDNKRERALWCLDQRINDRGILVDTELAHAAVQAAATERETLNAATHDATDGEVEAATQRDAMLAHILREHGVTLPDMTQATLKRRLDDPALPAAVKHLLDLRLQSSRNSSAKYTSAIKAVSEDGRLRAGLQFCGAATSGRWAGRVVQPQNLMRPTMPHAAIETAIDDIKAGAAPMLYSNLPEVLGNAVRGLFVAPEGRKLVCSDLKSIEGRGLAWLADDERVVQFYRDFDAGKVSYDSYQLAYTLVFGGDPAKVVKAERTVGKPIELAFGYGGGVAAFLTFAAVYYLNLDALADTVWGLADTSLIRECSEKYDWAKKQGFHAGMDRHKYAAFEYAKTKWRQSRQPTTVLWRELADAFRFCVAHDRTAVDIREGKLKMRRDGQWMRLRLPSGRCITMLQPRAGSDGQLTYKGLDRYTRQWTDVFTHGGKLAGVVTQSFARDVLAHNMPLVESSGFDVVLSVHDELITEAPDAPGFSAAKLNALMSRVPEWAPGLPLAADGFEAKRYRKDD